MVERMRLAVAIANLGVFFFFFFSFGKPDSSDHVVTFFLRKRVISITAFVIRGELAVVREERRCARTGLHLSRWPAPSFRLVPGGPTGIEGGWMSMPHRTDATGHRRANPFSTWNRAIYRPPTSQPASQSASQPASQSARQAPRSHSPDPRVENHGYHERESGYSRERGTGGARRRGG